MTHVLEALRSVQVRQDGKSWLFTAHMKDALVQLWRDSSQGFTKASVACGDYEIVVHLTHRKSIDQNSTTKGE